MVWNARGYSQVCHPVRVVCPFWATDLTKVVLYHTHFHPQPGIEGHGVIAIDTNHKRSLLHQCARPFRWIRVHQDVSKVESKISTNQCTEDQWTAGLMKSWVHASLCAVADEAEAAGDGERRPHEATEGGPRERAREGTRGAAAARGGAGARERAAAPAVPFQVFPGQQPQVPLSPQQQEVLPLPQPRQKGQGPRQGQVITERLWSCQTLERWHTRNCDVEMGNPLVQARCHCAMDESWNFFFGADLQETPISQQWEAVTQQSTFQPRQRPRSPQALPQQRQAQVPRQGPVLPGQGQVVPG